jgi:D-lactate dehydrogenase
MKPTARLINASRGPIVEKQALISVLKNKQIAGAAIDVFDRQELGKADPVVISIFWDSQRSFPRK